MPVSRASRRPSPGKIVRRWLYLVHRWIGIASCILFAMWFLSGLVMIYVPYPSLSKAQELAGAEAIDWTKVDRAPHLDGMPRHLMLEMRDGSPVWRIERWDGVSGTVSASAGHAIRPVDATMAARVARGFGGRPVRAVESLMRDQWTVAGGFDRHRPLCKVTLDDPGGTELYVSSTTAGVVQRTTRRQRFWNWLGSVPHWLYPTVLRQDNSAWRQVVLWVSGPCIAGAVTGLWIGILRIRPGRRRFRAGRVTPYHGWMVWHHVAGLVGGLSLIAWIFSGWLSVDPGGLFRGRALDDAAIRHYAASSAMPALDLEGLARVGHGARRVELTDFAGQRRLVFSYGDGTRVVRDAVSLAPASASEGAILSSARALVPDGRIVAIDRLTAPDAYWYATDGLPRLPVLRLRFDDRAGTWLHVDPLTGEVLTVMDDRRRLYRWLFDLLHKWDVNILIRNRPSWDLLLWTLSLFGLVTSVSGIWIGWKRLMPGRRSR